MSYRPCETNGIAPVEGAPAVFPPARDPDDEPYLNLAIYASADYLITRDNDMLDLMRDADFRVRYSDARDS